jgi:hypothetical protein
MGNPFGCENRASARAAAILECGALEKLENVPPDLFGFF